MGWDSVELEECCGMTGLENSVVKFCWDFLDHTSSLQPDPSLSLTALGWAVWNIDRMRSHIEATGLCLERVGVRDHVHVGVVLSR